MLILQSPYSRADDLIAAIDDAQIEGEILSDFDADDFSAQIPDTSENRAAARYLALINDFEVAIS